MTLEEAYLEHILLHLRCNDPDDRPLRTYVDSWFAHTKGTALLERRIARPQWLNTGDLAKRPDLAFQMHAVSRKAKEKIAAGDPAGLVKHHTVPMRQIIAELKAASFNDRNELRSYLSRRYRLAVITHDEHAKISHQGVGDEVYAHLDAAGIEYEILS